MIRGKYDEKEISGCAISGILSESGKRIDGSAIIASIANMHDRSNGLGGGFAAYGIYPENADHYAFHLMFDSDEARAATEECIGNDYIIERAEEIPTEPVESIRNRPILHRYFLTLKSDLRERHYDLTEEEIVMMTVMHINLNILGAFVSSSGKNMGIFKGVGFPEDIGEFFRLREYKAHAWISHGRFPTNTSGWWGGAHPFGLLDWAIVHNGEISSYGINRRYLSNFGYQCTLQTDTEVICYLFDLLVRKHGLSFEVACTAMAAPFWKDIERLAPEEQEIVTALRMVYGGALLNGPFSVVVAFNGGMIGFNDRIKLRPMVAARKDDFLYMASEEAAIRVVCPDPDKVWQAEGGKPIIGRLKTAERKEEVEKVAG